MAGTRCLPFSYCSGELTVAFYWRELQYCPQFSSLVKIIIAIDQHQNLFELETFCQVLYTMFIGAHQSCLLMFFPQSYE